MPSEQIHHAVAPVHFHHGRDERDEIVPDVADVGALVRREAIRELHECGGRAGFRGVNGPGDVVHRRDFRDDARRLGVVHADAARIRQLCELRTILVELRHQGFGRHGDR